MVTQPLLAAQWVASSHHHQPHKENTDMQQTEAITDLLEGYAAYTDASELSIDATSAAPALPTTPVCVAAIISSWKCAAASGASAATLINGC